VHGHSADLTADTVQVALLDSASPSFVRQVGQYRTLIAMDRGGRNWSLTPPLQPQEGGYPTCPDNAFSVLHVETWDQNDGRPASALLAEAGEGDEKIVFRIEGVEREKEQLTLPLVEPRYVSLTQSRTGTGQQALVAKFDDNPIPVHLHGCTLSIGNPVGTPPFEIVQYEDPTGTIQCEPGIHRVAVPLAGALVEPMEVPFGARLILAQNKLRKKRAPFLRPPNSKAGSNSTNSKKATGGQDAVSDPRISGRNCTGEN